MWFLTAMLMVVFGTPVTAKDSDFIAYELNRYARSKMSRLSNTQRQVVNLADRYRIQKQGQLRAKNLAAPAAAAAAAIPPTADPAAIERPNYPSTGSGGDALVLVSLTQEDCATMVSALDDRKHAQGVILNTQRQLVFLGFDLAKVDDKLGEETKSKLSLFCVGARYALSDDILDMVRIHAEISRAVPDWLQILASREFESWALTQSDLENISRIRQMGNSKEVIKLLGRYKTRKPAIVLTDDFHVSYLLTKDDFAQLQSTAGISKLVEKLQGETFASKKDFDAGLEAAFKGVANPERYILLTQKYAELQTGLMLTEESFKNLKVKNVPDYVLNAMQELKDLNYPDTQINEAVDDIANNLAERLKEFKPDEIVKLAKSSSTGIRFTDESIKSFSDSIKKENPLSQVILERIQKMQIVEYQSDKTMLSAMKNVLRQVADEINNSVPVIIGETKEVTGYSLSEESVQEIKDQLKDFIVPEIYLELLSKMQDIEFPDQDLFWMATKSEITVTGLYNELRQSILGVIHKFNVNKVDKVLLAKLREEKVPPAVLAQLGTLQERKFEDAKALEDEISKMFVQLNERFDTYRPMVIAQAKKKHSIDKTKSIQWSGESCNCVHDHLAGVVYGFFPYWRAGEKQVIDFGVLSRIGYYGLGFDDKGNIVDSARWVDQDTSFLKEARTYNTKVDLVVTRSDWNAWNQFTIEEKTQIFENLAANIVSLIDIPLEDLGSRARPYLTLGTSPTPAMADGVTLNFKGYPQDKDSVAAFKAFTLSLKEHFRARHRKYSLNLMFSRSEIGKGIYDYLKLIDFMDVMADHDKKTKNLFLVLLDEPTSDNKKLLRINIEREMHSSARVKLLRNIVLIRSVDKNDESQVVDDVIYAKDNFGGIGFWPQPLGAPGNAAENMISKALNKYYITKTGVETDFNREVCHFICPNRLAFQVVWEIFVLVVLACVMLYFGQCGCRTTIEKYFIYIIAGLVVPAFLLSMSLLYCDPFLSSIFGGDALLLIVVLALIGYSIWNHRDKLRKANLP